MNMNDEIVKITWRPKGEKWSTENQSKWSKEQLIAYDVFLWSELLRHQEDIEMINKKRHKLHLCGYVAKESSPWINESDII